jgi:hypothetical protein
VIGAVGKTKDVSVVTWKAISVQLVAPPLFRRPNSATSKAAFGVQDALMAAPSGVDASPTVRAVMRRQR